MPQGYGPAMRIFTKICKIPFSYLRKKGFISVVYVDDSYLQASSFAECQQNVQDTVALLEELGFTIHDKKSSLVPKQHITFLGFEFNSLDMTIRLTNVKKVRIVDICVALLNRPNNTIRELAKVIGNLVASFYGVTYGPLFYRYLEHDKTLALKTSRYNFDSSVTLSYEAKLELQWWIKNIKTSYKNIATCDPDIVIHTDARLTGWGVTDGKNPSGGFWIESEIEHINILELKAVLYAITIYCKNKNYSHIRIMCDNTTAISYINNMGGQVSLPCFKIAKTIWQFCMNSNTWLSAAHIAGCKNIIADKYSRKLDDSTEWQLNPKIFNI